MKLEIQTIREITKTPAIVHCSSIVQANDKELWCVWYECPYETSMETVIKISRKGQNDAEWGPDETLFDFHGMGLGNPVIWTMDGKEVHIVFSALLEESWAKGQIFYSSTTDHGKTWTPPTLFVHQIGFMAKTRPVINKRNQILFPLYHEGEICPYVLVYDDWKSPLEGKLIAETMARTKAIQPTLLHLEQSIYLMFSRTNQGCIHKSLSYNNGMSWSPYHVETLGIHSINFDYAYLLETGKLRFQTYSTTTGKVKVWTVGFSENKTPGAETTQASQKISASRGKIE